MIQLSIHKNIKDTKDATTIYNYQQNKQALTK